MTYTIEISEFAVQDIAEIIEWYRDQKEGLEYEFVSSLEITLGQVESNPLAFQLRIKQSRVALLQRFPYKVVFKIYGSIIKIIGVIHHSRNPKLIRKRLK